MCFWYEDRRGFVVLCKERKGFVVFFNDGMVTSKMGKSVTRGSLAHADEYIVGVVALRAG